MGIFGESKREKERRIVYKDYLRQMKYHAGRGCSEHEAREQALNDVNQRGANVSGSDMDSTSREGQEKKWGGSRMQNWENDPDWPPKG